MIDYLVESIGKSALGCQDLIGFLSKNDICFIEAAKFKCGYESVAVSHYDEIFYINFRNEGVGFLFENYEFDFDRQSRAEDWVLHTVFFHREGHEGFSEYKGRLPFDVNFEDDYVAIKNKVGRECDKKTDYIMSWYLSDRVSFIVDTIGELRPNMFLLSLRSD